MRFKNRTDAGRQLAEKLMEYRPDRPLILALPRGGVPVGYEVAVALKAPLDILVARKIGSPANPEFGMGAIAPGGVLVLDDKAVGLSELEREDLNPIIEAELAEMERRMIRYRSGEWGGKAPRKTVVVIDDGLATGVTARAALESAKIIYRPEKLVFAAPVCAKQSLELLKPYADKIICILKPVNLAAIGEWYEDFRQTTDEEVLSCLDQNKNMLELSE